MKLGPMAVPIFERDAGFYCPKFSLALRTLTIVRALSSAINIIHDCDETFNYWEPLHFLLFGKGLQVCLDSSASSVVVF
jgi:hypothetical protein